MRHPNAGPWLRLAVGLVKPLLLLVVRRDWRGREHVPSSGPVILCTNHVSHLDPFTFACFVWDCGRAPRFLAKAEVFELPVLGRIVAGARQIRVERETGDAATAYGAALAALRQGEALCIYPEATLTRDPRLWPMRGKTGAARLALQTGAPVVPVAQWGPQAVLAPYARRPHLFPRHTVHALAGPPVDLSDLADLPLTADVLHTATERILDAIAGQLSVLRGEPVPEGRVDPRTLGVPVIGNPHRRKDVHAQPEGPPLRRSDDAEGRS